MSSGKGGNGSEFLTAFSEALLKEASSDDPDNTSKLSTAQFANKVKEIFIVPLGEPSGFTAAAEIFLYINL